MSRSREEERQRKAAYRARKRAQEEAAASPDGISPTLAAELAKPNPNRVALEEVRDHATLPADRTRAAVELTKLDELERRQHGEDQFAELRALRDALDSIPPKQRAAALGSLLAVRDDEEEA